MRGTARRVHKYSAPDPRDETKDVWLEERGPAGAWRDQLEAYSRQQRQDLRRFLAAAAIQRAFRCSVARFRAETRRYLVGERQRRPDQRDAVRGFAVSTRRHSAPPASSICLHDI